MSNEGIGSEWGRARGTSARGAKLRQESAGMPGEASVVWRLIPEGGLERVGWAEAEGPCSLV